VTIEFVQAYFHWFNYLRPAPGPENDLKAGFTGRPAPTDPVQAEYFRVSSDPAAIHAMCEDYRAGASIDLKHDQADLDKKIACPVLALWGERGPMGRLYDVLSIWKERAAKATGKGLPTGHSLQEEAPDLVTSEIRSFLRS
jgi:haloacetate dehalogenase